MVVDLDLGAPLASLQLYLVLLARVGALLALLPALGDRGVPVRLRAALAALLAFLVLPTVKMPAGMPWRWEAVGAALPGEMLLGLTMGFCVQAVFEALGVGCRILETQMGYALGSVALPGAGGSHSALGSLLHALALVLFFTSGAYHLVLRALVRSFALLAPGEVLSPHGEILFPLDAVVGMGSQMVVCAVEIVAPVMGAVFLAEVALALLARAVPQMNVFAVGFPVKITVGLLVASASLALSMHGFTRALHITLARLLAGMGGR